jgi:hypothetical protein
MSFMLTHVHFGVALLPEAATLLAPRLLARPKAALYLGI